MQTPGQVRATRALRIALLAAVAGLAAACSHIPHRRVSHVPAPPAPAPEESERSLVVTATAYNSVPSQTGRVSDIGAWGDRLTPGMKVIAVTPDLLALGLKRGDKVRIEGVAGEWTVMDKVPARWQRRIDLFMGKDVRAARRWGKRQVEISW